jgi:hypothetical protein
MRLRLRTGLAVGPLVVLATLLMPQEAGAQEVPTITVTPNSGLVDGQLVSLTGAGYLHLNLVAALECPADFVAGRFDFEVTELLNSCTFLREPLAAAFSRDQAGNLTGTAMVQEVFTSEEGLGRPPTTYDCAVSNDCVVLVGGLTETIQFRGAAAPISFGAATPTSKADCKNGGWRDLANDQGQPFRNQGQCVSFVVAHRR